jgi:hypothetical protein
VIALRRRRAAVQRMSPYGACSCVDPWTCRHGEGPPSERMVDGYRDAILHLDANGLLAAPLLPELQIMWRRGGTDRQLAVHIAERWELAA